MYNGFLEQIQEAYLTQGNRTEKSISINFDSSFNSKMATRTNKEETKIKSKTILKKVTTIKQ